MRSSFGLTSAQTAARVATVAFGVAILLQLLLAAGVLPVSMAWGGAQTTLTLPLRIASVLAAGVLALCAYVIRRRAGLAGKGAPSRAIRLLSWVITIYLFLNTAANLLSPSMGEKILFGSITLVLAVSCLIVSASGTSE